MESLWRHFKTKKTTSNAYICLHLSIRIKNILIHLVTQCVACIWRYIMALVKYGNEGGPGPRYNMKEVPGSTLIMLIVHAYPVPLSSEAGDQKTSGVGLPPPPHQSKLGKAPSHPLLGHTPPLQRCR